MLKKISQNIEKTGVIGSYEIQAFFLKFWQKSFLQCEDNNSGNQ